MRSFAPINSSSSGLASLRGARASIDFDDDVDQLEILADAPHRADHVARVPLHDFVEMRFHSAPGGQMPSERSPSQIVVRHGAEDARVFADGAIVAQHEDALRRHGDLRHAARIAEVHVGFAQPLAVDVDDAAIDAHAVARNADHAFDIGLGRDAVVAERDDLAAPRRSELDTQAY